MSEGLVHTHLDSGIHRIHWQDVGQKAIEEYIDILLRIANDLPANEVLRILHDYRDTDTPPFKAMANAMKGLSVRDDIVLRIAHIYSDNSYPMIVQNATIVARFDANRKFFKVDEAEQAIEWLLNSE